ncbi:hypothetical protein GCM10010094_13350 [Streptomyces flaveus]|uniref:Uncharacterized protein n=1 Tax=Streptomyces flaveus TaxID=66370 RepID=A0A917QKZ8_9ACTN|nr:hypothetical protein GCM10010094_13350 [Streptomyces flaveus]
MRGSTEMKRPMPGAYSREGNAAVVVLNDVVSAAEADSARRRRRVIAVRFGRMPGRGRRMRGRSTGLRMAYAAGGGVPLDFTPVPASHS